MAAIENIDELEWIDIESIAELKQEFVDNKWKQTRTDRFIIWNYDRKMLIKIIFGHLLSFSVHCYFGIWKATFCVCNWDSLEIVLEEAFKQYSKNILYTAMQNLIALVKENDVSNIVADLKYSMITYEKNKTKYKFLVSTRERTTVLIEHFYYGIFGARKCTFDFDPNDVRKMQAEFLGILPNKKKCLKFWKRLKTQYPWFKLKLQRNNFKSFYFYCDFIDESLEKLKWIEIDLCDSGNRFSLTICLRGFYEDTLEHKIKDAKWADFQKIDGIADKLHENDVVDTCLL